MMPDLLWILLTLFLCAACSWIAYRESVIHVLKKTNAQLQSEDFIRGAALNKIWKGTFNEQNTRLVSNFVNWLRSPRGSGDRGNRERHEPGGGNINTGPATERGRPGQQSQEGSGDKRPVRQQEKGEQRWQSAGGEISCGPKEES